MRSKFSKFTPVHPAIDSTLRAKLIFNDVNQLGAGGMAISEKWWKYRFENFDSRQTLSLLCYDFQFLS